MPGTAPIASYSRRTGGAGTTKSRWKGAWLAACIAWRVWAALHEVSYWRRVAPAIPQTQIDEWLQGLPVVVEENGKSFLRRVFSR